MVHFYSFWRGIYQAWLFVFAFVVLQYRQAYIVLSTKNIGKSILCFVMVVFLLIRCVCMKRVLVGLVVLGLAGCVYALPYIAVNDLKESVKAKDAEAIEERVDFVRLRMSLKDQFNSVMMAKMDEESDKIKNNPFMGLGMMLASSMVDKMVDASITPAGLRRMMAGEKPIQKKSVKEDGKEAERVDSQFEEARMGYDSDSKFSVYVPSRSKKTGEVKEVRLVLRRDGLTWRLTDVILPLPSK